MKQLSPIIIMAIFSLGLVVNRLGSKVFHESASISREALQTPEHSIYGCKYFLKGALKALHNKWLGYFNYDAFNLFNWVTQIGWALPTGHNTAMRYLGHLELSDHSS